MQMDHVNRVPNKWRTLPRFHRPVLEYQESLRRQSQCRARGAVDLAERRLLEPCRRPLSRLEEMAANQDMKGRHMCQEICTILQQACRRSCTDFALPSNHKIGSSNGVGELHLSRHQFNAREQLGMTECHEAGTETAGGATSGHRRYVTRGSQIAAP
jgi:hypothetical protein